MGGERRNRREPEGMKEDERRGMHVLRRVFFTKREHM